MSLFTVDNSLAMPRVQPRKKSVTKRETKKGQDQGPSDTKKGASDSKKGASESKQGTSESKQGTSEAKKGALESKKGALESKKGASESKKRASCSKKDDPNTLSMVQRSGGTSDRFTNRTQSTEDKDKFNRQDSGALPPEPTQRSTSTGYPKAYRNLGKSGLRVSNIGLGSWVTFGAQVTDEMAEEMVTLAYESGINVFDTAEVYAAGKAEIVLGKILKKKGWRRSSYIITTKLYWGGKAETEKGLSRKHIVEGLKASLERLQMDYVDIVFANKTDPHTPMEEIVRAFTHVISNGQAMYWGTSRWSPMEIMEAYSVARQFNLIPPIAEQAEYHLFQREKVELQMPELYHKIGYGSITFSSLAGGFLTGKYDDGVPTHSRAALKGYGWLKDRILSEEGRRQQAKLRELAVIADKLGCSLAQLAIAWCLKNDSVHCVMLGASSVDQLYENMQALQVVSKLSAPLLNELDNILANRPVRKSNQMRI